MADLVEPVALSSFAKTAFAQDMRLMAQANNIPVDEAFEASVEASLSRFAEQQQELIAEHGADAVMGCSFVDPTVLGTAPSLASMGSWQQLKGDGESAFSNRFIVDMTMTPPHLEGWQPSLATENPAKTLAQLSSFKDRPWPIDQLLVNMRMRLPDGQNYIAIAAPGTDDCLLVKEEYLSYFNSKLEDLELRASQDLNMLSVWDAGVFKGMIGASQNIPAILKSVSAQKNVAQAKRDTFAQLVREMQASKEQSPGPAPAPAPAAVAEPENVTADESPAVQPSPAEGEVHVVDEWSAVIPARDNTPDTGPMPEGFEPSPAWSGRGPSVTISNDFAGVTAAPVPTQETASPASTAGGDIDDDLAGVQAYDPALVGELVETDATAAAVQPDPSAVPAAEPVADPIADIAAMPNDLDGPASETPPVVVPTANATFDLGEPIDAPYASNETYMKLLEARLAEAVSPEHEKKIIEQEILNLGHSKEKAQEIATHFETLLKRFGGHRDVDATGYYLGRFFDSTAEFWLRRNHPLPTPKDRITANLDHLAQTLGSYDKQPTPAIDVGAAQANVVQGSASAFRRASSVAGLEGIENVLNQATPPVDPHARQRALEALASGRVADMTFSHLPDGGPTTAPVEPAPVKLSGDPVYLATKTNNVFNQMRPEHLMTKDQEIDRTWVNTVQTKITSITEKLSVANLAAEVREHIKAMIDSIMATFKALVEAAEKLFKKANVKLLDGGRIDPSFDGLER